ncbi:hypothetical protein EGW08_015179 [Elysia chlorotica]|uniref:Uncharacterized protein n=1 Tax=Elysia chlorotica TaxID=188477 RepID=A0A3S1BBY8_ELYCH|nr:hypothetical protein EGW08_015179 [Elysia chlorotica]
MYLETHLGVINNTNLRHSININLKKNNHKTCLNPVYTCSLSNIKAMMLCCLNKLLRQIRITCVLLNMKSNLNHHLQVLFNMNTYAHSDTHIHTHLMHTHARKEGLSFSLMVSKHHFVKLNFIGVNYDTQRS